MDVLNPDALALMRARARHRLIGAIVLVLILVIGVPFLLDQSVLDVPVPPPAAVPGAALPSALPAAPEAARPMAATATVATAAGLSNTPEAGPAAGPPAQASVTPPAPAPAANATSGLQPPAAPINPSYPDGGRPVLLLAERPREEAPARPPVKAPVRPDPAAKPVDAEPANPGGHAVRGWFVQYGVFFEAPRAEALAARLSEHGILVSSERLHGPRGQFTRLRSGPFNNRPSADTVLARAHALGENAILVHQ